MHIFMCGNIALICRKEIIFSLIGLKWKYWKGLTSLKLIQYKNKNNCLSLLYFLYCKFPLQNQIESKYKMIKRQ